MIRLSVIIPMYNVEESLQKCILSVLENDLTADEFEIVIVDDESPDHSLAIANKIAKDHANIHIISQKNKGLGGARNTGIDAASGMYLMFLDSDDYVVGSLKNLLSKAIKDKPEILEFGAASVDLNGKIIKPIRVDTNNLAYHGTDYWQSFPSINSACNKLYLRDFLNSNRLQFLEKIFAEDFEFNTRALFYAKKVRAINDYVSNFVQSENSITRNKSQKSKQKYINDFTTILKSIRDFKDKVKDKEDFFLERLTMLNVDLFLFMLKNGFSRKEMKGVKRTLKMSGTFYVNHSIRGFRKNMLRLILLKHLPLI